MSAFLDGATVSPILHNSLMDKTIVMIGFVKKYQKTARLVRHRIVAKAVARPV